MKIVSLWLGLILFVLVTSGFAAETMLTNASDVINPLDALEGNTTSSEQPMPDWIFFQYPPYEATGKPDPFVSFIKVREYERMEEARKAKKEKKASTPLETVEVHSLRLIGIIENKDGTSVAMVELPDGKGYLIHTGMIVGLYDGVVTSIGDGVLIVEENIMDLFGENKKRTITLRLRQE